MLTRRRKITTREEWLEWRKHDVTASRVGALFGCHPYETALRLSVEKRGVEFENISNEAMQRGEDLEPVIGKRVGRLRPDWIIEPANMYLDYPEIRLGATPDFYIHGDPRGLGVLQAKTVAPSVFHRDWNEGREVPFWIVLQTLTEAMLVDATFAVVAPMVVDSRLECHIIEVRRNPGAELKIIRAVKDFWNDVAEGNEPAPDFSRDAEVIRALSPRSREGSVADFAGNNEIPELCARYEALGEGIRGLETRRETIATELKFKMGDAETSAGVADWLITYKTGERKAYSVPAKTLRTLRIYDRRKESR